MATATVSDSAESIVTEELPGELPPGEANELLDYLDAESRSYGFEQLAGSRSVAYFYPLLHELFSGGEVKTRIVFSLLHGLMLDDRVRWTRTELDEKYHWLREGHRNYLLQRLSSVGWLEYLRDQQAYMVSDRGEALMRVLSRFSLGRELVENEGTAVAEIEFSLLLEFDDVPERLQYLKNRLHKHAIRAESALQSDSAYRILEIYQQLKAAYRWAEQTRQTLDHIEIGDDEDTAQWTAIRGVHDHLSHLHALISRMQLVLQDIQRKQIDIARYGLTHLDFDNYLINGSVDRLAGLMRRHLRRVPHPLFVQQDGLFAEAAEVLFREPVTREGLRGWDTNAGEPEDEQSRDLPIETEELAGDLDRAPKSWAGVNELVDGQPWEVAAYRLAILTLLADLDPWRREADDRIDPLIDVPVEVEFGGEMGPVQGEKGEPWQMSRGRLRRLPDRPTRVPQQRN